MAGRIERLLCGAGLATAQISPDMRFLELVEPLRAPIPANCSNWEELFPTPGLISHQDEYVDADGDGEINFCDYIILDGEPFHIEWVGPTYYLECGIFEPYDNPDPTGEDPTCETWIEISPNHGELWHMSEFQDNGDGVISPCDYVRIGDQLCHIMDIRLNIRARPGDPTPNEHKAWGEVKDQYGD